MKQRSNTRYGPKIYIKLLSKDRQCVRKRGTDRERKRQRKRIKRIKVDDVWFVSITRAFCV